MESGNSKHKPLWTIHFIDQKMTKDVPESICTAILWTKLFCILILAVCQDALQTIILEHVQFIQSYEIKVNKHLQK